MTMVSLKNWDSHLFNDTTESFISSLEVNNSSHWKAGIFIWKSVHFLLRNSVHHYCFMFLTRKFLFEFLTFSLNNLITTIILRNNEIMLTSLQDKLLTNYVNKFIASNRVSFLVLSYPPPSTTLLQLIIIVYKSWQFWNTGC